MVFTYDKRGVGESGGVYAGPEVGTNLMRMVGISVQRKSRSRQVIGTNEKLTPYEALKAITIWSAYQHFEEHTKGTLEEGKLADMVILDKNPLKVSEDVIKEIVVIETIKEGVSVYTK